MDASDFQYVIVPTRLYRASTCAAAQNLVYDFWNAHWSKTFAASGAPESGWQDHFMRQDLAVAVVSKRSGEVIGCHLYTVYNLASNASLNSEYFHYISRESTEHMKTNDLNICMSMEYLGINPEWTINPAKIGFGKLMVALGTFVAEALECDCALGMPIGGTKVDKMIANLGGYTIQDNIQKYGYELQLMVMPARPRINSEDPLIAQWAARLWAERQDHTGLTVKKNPTLKTQTLHKAS